MTTDGTTGGRAAGTGGGDPAARGGSGPAPGGSVHIGGSMTGGAIATGAYGRATSYTYGSAPDGTDEAHRALLEAVRTLRAEVSALAPGDATREAAAELAAVEEEITRDGRADTGRLARLRERLAPGAGVLGLLASAATVAQAIGQVLG